MMGDNRHNSEVEFWFCSYDHILGEASFIWSHITIKKIICLCL